MDFKPIRFRTPQQESEIARKLDEAAKEDSPAPGLAVQERQRAVVHKSDDDVCAKTAEAICRLRVRRRLAKFRKSD